MTQETNQPPSPTEVQAARELLGLSLGANREEINTAWKSALRLTHPDRADEDSRAMAEQLSQRVNEARRVLLADSAVTEASLAASREGSARNWWNGPDPAPGATEQATRRRGSKVDAGSRPGEPSSKSDWRGASQPAGSNPWTATGTAGTTSGSATATESPAAAHRDTPDHTQDSMWKHTRVRAALAVSAVAIVIAGLVTWIYLTQTQDSRIDTARSQVSEPTTLPESATLGDMVRSQEVAASVFTQTAAPTPEAAFRALTLAAQGDDAEMLQGLLDPVSWSAQVGEIVDLLADDDITAQTLQQARSNVRCERLIDPNLAVCASPALDPALPNAIEFRKRPKGWRVVGWDLAG